MRTYAGSRRSRCDKSAMTSRRFTDQGLRGRDDHEIAEACRAEGRVPISLDLDFSNIQNFPPENCPGSIVLRLRTKGRTAGESVFRRVISHLDQQPIAGRLWIVDEQRIPHPPRSRRRRLKVNSRRGWRQATEAITVTLCDPGFPSSSWTCQLHPSVQSPTLKPSCARSAKTGSG